MSNTPDNLLEVGHVIDAQGIQGQIKIRPYSSDPEALLQTKRLWLQASVGFSKLTHEFPVLYDVSSARFHSGNVIIKLKGVEGRDAALLLKGCVGFLSREDFPELEDDGTYYWTDLMGSEVRNQEGQVLGLVDEMLDNGVQSILSVIDDAKKQHLIPFVEPIIQTVDLKSEPKKIVVDWQADW